MQFLLFSLPKWPVHSSESLFEQIPNIVCQMNVPLQGLSLQGTECAAHTTYCRFGMGIETQRRGWFVTNGWDNPSLQWDGPATLPWFGWNSNDCSSLWSESWFGSVVCRTVKQWLWKRIILRSISIRPKVDKWYWTVHFLTSEHFYFWAIAKGYIYIYIYINTESQPFTS